MGHQTLKKLPTLIIPGLIIIAMAVTWYLVWGLGFGESKAFIAKQMLGSWKALVAWPVLIVAITAFAPWRFILWLIYRPMPQLTGDDLPEVTVVIPAYNEGARVSSSIQTVLASDYPEHLLRVIVVDDGSTDDTLKHIQAAVKGNPRVTVMSLGRNQGKRAALYAGFLRVKTPFVITVDSDTELPTGSIRAILAPLVGNLDVGAVAGRIEVRNRHDNALTRMLAVRYRYGFNYTRAYQSKLASVFVCPGAFTAYRMSAIQDGLEDWRYQQFLGKQCTNGDDHALSNLILSKGLATKYQSSAVALTHVPNTYKKLSLMYLRWARSNVRESLRYMGFCHLLLGHSKRWLAVLDAALRFVQIPLRIWLILLGFVVIAVNPLVLLKSIAVAMLFSLFPALVFLKTERSLDAIYAILYGVFSLLTLQWIYPLAAVTVRQSKWLTR